MRYLDQILYSKTLQSWYAVPRQMLKSWSGEVLLNQSIWTPDNSKIADSVTELQFCALASDSQFRISIMDFVDKKVVPSRPESGLSGRT